MPKLMEAFRSSRLISTSMQTEAEQLDAFLADLAGRQSPKGFIGLDTGFAHW